MLLHVNGQWQVVSDEVENENPHKSRSADLRRVGGLAVVLLVVAASIAWNSIDRSTNAQCWGSSPTGAMTFARSGHTATLLRSGKVLVAGGATGPQMASSAELYDPTTGTWTATGSMRSGRVGHAAALLPSGKVLVVGGSGPADGGASPSTSSWEPLASAEIYDPDSGIWTETSSMSVAANSLTAIVLQSGKVFVAPGLWAEGAANYRASLTTHAAEVYDPVSNTWSVIGGLIEPLGSATLLPSGEVLVLNGRSDTTQLYDPATGSWRAMAGMVANSDWYSHTATLLPSGKVLVLGGPFATQTTSAEIYDPAMDAWTPTSAIATPHIDGPGVTLLPFGKVLVAGGGRASPGGIPMVIDSADIYDPATVSWNTSGVMTAARMFFTATLLPSGAVLFAGGLNGRTGVYSSAEIYAARTCD